MAHGRGVQVHASKVLVVQTWEKPQEKGDEVQKTAWVLAAAALVLGVALVRKVPSVLD